jgi:hypothetical protein
VDISIVDGNSIKLRGKQATFVVDPGKQMPKTAADGVILLNGKTNIDFSRVTDYRIVIDGPGEYEVGGVKISGIKTSKGVLYSLSIDDISVVLGSAAEAKIEGFNACQIAVVNTTGEFNDSFVTALEPKISVLYGEKKAEAAKALGAEAVVPIAKMSAAKDKFPEKMEVVVLG